MKFTPSSIVKCKASLEQLATGILSKRIAVPLEKPLCVCSLCAFAPAHPTVKASGELGRSGSGSKVSPVAVVCGGWRAGQRLREII